MNVTRFKGQISGHEGSHAEIVTDNIVAVDSYNNTMSIRFFPSISNDKIGELIVSPDATNIYLY